MLNLSQANPTDRFTGLAEIYAKCRPDYPTAALDFIQAHCGLGSTSLLVDIGSGTGISSRLFAARGIPVLGIDPNADMRAKAAAHEVSEGLPQPRYQDGKAEATGLPDACADAVLAAQAFHWFEPTATLAEFHRILKPGGWVVLMWNERDEADPFTAAYGTAFRTWPETVRIESARQRAGEPLLSCPLFTNRTCARFGNEQEMDRDGLLGRTFSSSYAPKEPDAVQALTALMLEVFERFQQDGLVRMRYVTSIYLGRRG